MDNDKLITIDITYIPNIDNITNLEKYALTKADIMLVSFNHTNWNLYTYSSSKSLSKVFTPTPLLYTYQ